MKYILSAIVFFISITANAKQSFVGQLAPDFNLQAQSGQWRSLTDYKEKWLVLYFYPKDNTPGCTTEAKNFRDSHQDFRALNSQIVGISLDDHSSHKSFSKQYQLPFDILSDPQQKAASAYQVLAGFGPLKYTKRQTFIIDPEGSIVHHFKKVEAKQHSKQVLAKLKQLQQQLN